MQRGGVDARFDRLTFPAMFCAPQFSILKHVPRTVSYFITSHFFLVVTTHTRLPGSAIKAISWIDLSTVIDMEIESRGFLFPRSVLTFTNATLTPGAIRKAVMSGQKLDTSQSQTKVQVTLRPSDASEVYELFHKQMSENKIFFKSQSERARGMALNGGNMGMDGSGMGGMSGGGNMAIINGGGSDAPRGSNAQLAEILNRFSQELAQFANALR